MNKNNSTSQFLHDQYEVIVVGGGHAGCEAALAAARMGCKTLLLTNNLDTIGYMSCNPAIGGLAKGHLVREIDALGGEMGRNADYAGIQFRRLNTTKGPAVRATRAQIDRNHYRIRMKEVLESVPTLRIKQGSVEDLIIENSVCCGVVTQLSEEYRANAVILTTGTFLNGLMHYGNKNFDGGRSGDSVSRGISRTLLDVGFQLGRLKTGTVPRVDGRSIDWNGLEMQPGDDPAPSFSFFSNEHPLRQIACAITYTNFATHEIIKNNLHLSPMYSGKIEGIGPRYCPSIEDKVVRFADKERHQVFLEPEGIGTHEVYVNGLSTSLPLDVQIAALRTIEGMQKVEIMRPGYAVEYDYILPQQLSSTLETKLLPGLFHAGQINGTSGYEEAAAQGLMAGINAAAKVLRRPQIVLGRAQAYIGVLIDDLVTKGTQEPYRMFTSRAEHRLLLREDNADMRLCDLGHELGLLATADYEKFLSKRLQVETLTNACASTSLTPTPETIEKLVLLGTNPIKKSTSLSELARRNEVDFRKMLQGFAPELLENVSDIVVEQAEIVLRYAGYLDLQQELVERMAKLEHLQIPEHIDWTTVPSLSHEVREKFRTVSPRTLGQASRISGVTPAAISVLMIHLRTLERAA